MLKNSKLAILFFMMVVMMLGFGIIIPIFPFFIEKLGAGGSALGAMMAGFSFMQFLFSPVWGNLSDRIGRKPVMIMGALGNAVSMLLFGLADSLWLLIASRILGGILSAATFPTAMAYISDSTKPEDRGQGMGVIGAAMGVGMVLGPGVGGWLAGDNLTVPFYFASGLSVLSAILAWAILPESLPPEKREVQSGSVLHGPDWGMLWKSLFGPIGFLLFLAFLVNFGMANFEGIFGLYAARRYNYGPQEVGTVLTVIGLVSSVIQGILTGPATRKLGDQMVINLSLVGSALGFGLMLVAQSYAAVLFTVGFFIFANSMLRPAIISLTSKRVPGAQGMAMGMNNAYQSLGRVVGPMVAGPLLDLNLYLPYSSAAVIMLVSFVLSILWLKPDAKPVVGVHTASTQDETPVHPGD